MTGVAGGLGKVASGAGNMAAAPFTSAETKEGGEGAADEAVETAGEVGGKAQEVAGGAKDTVGDAAGEAGGKAQEAAGGAKDTVGDVAGEGQKKLGLGE